MMSDCCNLVGNKLAVVSDESFATNCAWACFLCFLSGKIITATTSVGSLGCTILTTVCLLICVLLDLH